MNAPSQQEEFLVELPVFSGPFRLLAELILDQKVDVCDVPVARITDGFLRRGGGEMAAWTLEEATWFLAVCAALLELKVGRLLPRPAVETEEDLLGGASPDLLYARSLELHAYHRVASVLAERMERAARMVPRTAGPPPELAHLYPDVLARVSAVGLRDVAAALLRPAPTLDLAHVAPIRVTIAEAIEHVRGRLAAGALAGVRFRDLIDDDPELIHVVVRFLALLELHRQGQVELLQAEVFGEIEVRWSEEALTYDRADPGLEAVVELEPHGWDEDGDDPAAPPGGAVV